jgi:hypothetical protein
VISNSHPPAKHTPITDDGAARYPSESGEQAVATNNDVVGNLGQIVDLGVLADNGVVERAAVDARIGANGDTVLEDDTAELRNVDDAARARRRPKTRLTDDRPAMNANPIAYQSKGYDGPWANVAKTPDRNTGSHISAWPD